LVGMGLGAMVFARNDIQNRRREIMQSRKRMANTQGEQQTGISRPESTDNQSINESS
jgi:hypothetical protein